MDTRIETIIAEAQKVSEVVTVYGADLIGGLLTVVAGIVMIKVFLRVLRRLLEQVMIEDPRVLRKPRPVVYVLNIDAGCLQIGGRCWVDNAKYWTARCELLEKIALCMRKNGIELIPPQVGIQQPTDRPQVTTA